MGFIDVVNSINTEALTMSTKVLLYQQLCREIDYNCLWKDDTFPKMQATQKVAVCSKKITTRQTNYEVLNSLHSKFNILHWKVQ